MSGYYIKTPSPGLWDIYHPDTGEDRVVTRCYSSSQAFEVCKKLNDESGLMTLLEAERKISADLKQQVKNLNNFSSRYWQDVAHAEAKKHAEARDTIALLEGRVVNMANERDAALSDALQGKRENDHLRKTRAEQVNVIEDLKQQINKQGHTIRKYQDDALRARQEQEKLNRLLIEERCKNVLLRSKETRSLMQREGETLVEFTALYVSYGERHCQHLEGPEDTPFVNVAEQLCEWAEQFHREFGDGPWDDYYGMVEDFFRARVSIALNDGDLRLVRNK